MPNLRENIVVVLRNWPSPQFGWPADFADHLCSISCWGTKEQILDRIEDEMTKTAANLNGLCVDGAGI